MSEAVTVESTSAVTVIRLDDGKANALGPDVLSAIDAGLDQAEQAGQAVLLAGRPGRFSAGFDLGVMRQGVEAGIELVTAGARLAVRLARFPAPCVVASSGHALAMGAVLLSAADTRIGAEGDFKIGYNEVAIGMTTPIFLLELARVRISKRHFLRAVVQAEIYDPQGAVDAGFLDRLVPPDRVESVALETAEALAKLPRGAYARTRSLVWEATLSHVEATLEENVRAGFGG